MHGNDTHFHGSHPEHEPEQEPPSEAGPAGVERQLAHFTFMREEHEREVRLHFRDVPADQIAMVFRSAGASLITMTGERAALLAPTSARHTPPPAPTDKSRPKRTASLGRAAHAAGQADEVTMLYFYAQDDIVYTVSITSPPWAVRSVAGIYPVAALLESEVQSRLSVVFRNIEI
jgi:hypothetical protein